MTSIWIDFYISNRSCFEGDWNIYSNASYFGNLTRGSSASYWFVGSPSARRMGTTVTGRVTPTANKKQDMAGIGCR